jgi:small conductance mechanosensitive channel
MIAGFFMILEDQIRVGDVVRVNGVAGSVQAITLRTTVLRDVEGAVHVFTNGAIATLANLSRDFSYAVVDVAVARDSDVDQAMEALAGIGAAMQRDPAFAPALLEPIQVLGIEAIGTTRVTIRARFKTVPLKQGDVAHELRRRIVAEFGPRGIDRVG